EFFDLSAMLPRARHRLMHSREMPLFPYLPVIVWMGMIKVMLGATHDHDAQSMTDPTDLNDEPRKHHPLPRATHGRSHSLIIRVFPSSDLVGPQRGLESPRAQLGRPLPP